MLDTDVLERLLAAALEKGGDYADVFCERRRAASFRLQSGHVHETAFSVTQGVGIRVVSGESAGYAFSDDLSFESLQRAARIAALIARDSGSGPRSIHVAGTQIRPFYDTSREAHASSGQYVDLLARADSAARAFDPRISAVNATVTDELQDVWI
ncbi:MAG TPA: DNA gyrase modulator, partial [Candidatus Baltobacteraceae bacterium]